MEEEKSPVKYKSCCEKKCANSNCAFRDAGGCKCVCNVADSIAVLQSVIDGFTVARGCCYLPSIEAADAWRSAQSPERQHAEKGWREIDAPFLLKMALGRLIRMEEHE